MGFDRAARFRHGIPHAADSNGRPRSCGMADSLGGRQTPFASPAPVGQFLPRAPIADGGRNAIEYWFSPFQPVAKTAGLRIVFAPYGVTSCAQVNNFTVHGLGAVSCLCAGPERYPERSLQIIPRAACLAAIAS